jgi:hypothetical protein
LLRINRQLPTVLLVMGLLGLVLSIGYLVWLVLAGQKALTYLFFSGLGDLQHISKLKELGLTTDAAIYATLVTFFLELALTLILLWTSMGLLVLRPSARWSAVFYSIFMILVGTIDVILAVFVVKPESGVDVLAVITRGVIVVFAIVLWGTMFLPMVVAAFEAPAPTSLEEIPTEDQPPSSRRRSGARPVEKES